MNNFIMVLELFNIYGWRFFFWLFMPMNVAQDFEMKNGGFDIIRFGNLHNSYFRGTYFQNRSFTTHTGN